MVTNGIVLNWLSEVTRFAYVRTDRAVYDRVAVIEDNDGSLRIEYPKMRRHSKTKRTKLVIVQEYIPARYIHEARYYQD